MAIKLKPCPFCGGEGVMQEHIFHGYMSTYGVVCFDCCAETKQFYDNEYDAAASWNKRTDVQGEKMHEEQEKNVREAVGVIVR